MLQPQYLRLSPLGLALGCAAAALVAIVIRAVTFGFGYGMRGPVIHGAYGGMMQGGLAGFALFAAIGGIVTAGILGAIVAVTYNATLRQPPAV